MDEIKIAKNTLLCKLKENRTAHIEEFDEAYRKWLRKMVEIDKMAEAAYLKGMEFEVNAPVKPKSHEKDYDWIIDQIEWHVGDTIELDQYEFNQFVRDEWEWTKSFKISSSSSSSSASSYLHHK